MLLNLLQRVGVAHAHRLRSCPCTQAQLQSDVFQAWAVRMHEGPMHMHRKVWEYCYITQALYERGLLSPGRRGLGFAVGQEPLPALFASLGCQIVATDLETEEAHKNGWVETAQHSDSLDSLNRRGICDPMLFHQRVGFRFVDMRRLPDDLGTYDFIWSACSLEHLGTITLGEEFIYQSLRYLKPGGVAVHTTEFNLLSNDSTLTQGTTVLFRKKDVQRIATNLHRRGYRIDLDFAQGSLLYDRIVDEPPYKHEAHLRLLLAGYIVTSYGLIIES
jgi:2-polyprenyl-3-methyl-5-hydroxy-6-metoxy-1,4-benzoquinol methylase